MNDPRTDRTANGRTHRFQAGIFWKAGRRWNLITVAALEQSYLQISYLLGRETDSLFRVQAKRFIEFVKAG